MIKSLQSVESKVLRYLNFIDNNDAFLLITNEEIKNSIEEIKDFSTQEIFNIFKNLEKLDLIKIKYSSSENYLISLCEKGKIYFDNLKLKNPQNFTKNAKFYIFLLSVLGSFFGTILALIFYLYTNKLC